jgi:hypothetical protein
MSDRLFRACLRALVTMVGATGVLLLAGLPGGIATAAAAGNDSCGYASSSFTESTVMRWAQVNGQGKSAQIVGFANDEKGLLLGVNGATPLASAPVNGTNSHHASNASGGDPSLKDPSNRPFYPALYISDITNNPNATSGQYDFQSGGSPVNLNGGQPFIDDVFGAWSTATITNGNYTVTPPPAKNDWTLGTGSDQPVGTTFQAMGTEGYGAEVRWNASELTDGAGNPLQPGHTYRVQILTHDGDQNKSGGDAGEFCVTLKIPGQPSSMTTQASPSSGTVGDTITDTATVTGSNPTGTVTFELYNDASCTNLLYTDTESLSGGQATAAGYKTTVTGTYYWVDTYSGDANNTAAGPFPGAPGTAACSSDPLEQTSIGPRHPSLSTRATSAATVGDRITDTATVTGGFRPTGTVTFRLYNDASCTNLVYTDTEQLIGGVATAQGYTTTSPGTYYWVDTYNGDVNNTSSGPYPGAPGTPACSSDPLEQTPVSEPGIKVVKLDSVPCADLASDVTQPSDVSCAGTFTTFTQGIITLSVPHSGSYSIPIDYQIRVTNTGSTPLALSLNDPRCDAGSVAGPIRISGTLTNDTLSAGGQAYYTCTHTLTQNDPDTTISGQPFTNTATVTGTPPSGPPVHGTDIVTVDRKPLPPPPPVKRFCKAKRGPHKGHRVRWPEGKPKPRACKLPPPPPPHPKRPKHPHGFTG